MGQAVNYYKCPTCGATKEIRSQQVQTHVEFQVAYDSMPAKVPCGWRGCEDYAVKEPSEENAKDMCGATRAAGWGALSKCTRPKGHFPETPHSWVVDGG